MAHAIEARSARGDRNNAADTNVVGADITTTGGRDAFRILRVAYTIAPIAAGIDKFFNLLTDWQSYLASPLSKILGSGATTVMYVIGVLEIIMGAGVAVRPNLFGYVVAVWLLAIVVLNLLPGGMYELALHDLVLVVGALALARLSHQYHR